MPSEFVQVCLVHHGRRASAASTERHRTLAAASTLDYFEYRLSFGLRFLGIRVVDEAWVKLLKLIKFNKSTLVSEPLFGKVLAALVSYKSLALPAFLLLPVFKYFLTSLLPGKRPAKRLILCSTP